MEGLHRLFNSEHIDRLLANGVPGVVMLVIFAVIGVIMLRLAMGIIIFIVQRTLFKYGRVFATPKLKTAGPSSAEEFYAEAMKKKEAGDMAQAIEHLTRASNLGHGLAGFQLASIYYDGGQGTRKNPVLAVEYFRKSAMKGIAPAMDALAQIYQYGEGVVLDPIKAYIWCVVAKAAGISNATERQLRYETLLLRDYTPSHLNSWRGEAARLFEQIMVNSKREITNSDS